MITVNFNGKKFLKGLIESLAAQTFQADEIIVVDNFSTDESVAYIKENFPYIKIVQSNINNGFAGGNNLGVRSAIHPLVALINNDTIVEPTWLENLVGTWVKQTASGEKIGAVSPKITFLRKFLTFQLTAPLFRYGDGDERFLGVAIDFSNSGITNANYIKPIIVSGFHQEENWPGGRIVHWTSGHAELMLPIPEDYINDKVILKIIATAGNRVGGSELKIECKGLDLGTYRINDDFSDICVEIPTELLKSASWVINNAGSKLNEYGNAADIGINQIDKGQFDDVSNIDAFCGCSVLISRATFLTLGGFDDRFFMYYEDADLSWKMRKNNLKIIFESKSVVRHIHAGSSGEWSPGFRYYVTRNYRLIGFKNASLINLIFLILRFFITFCFSLRINGLNVWRKQKRNKLVDMTPAQIELKALTDVFALTPRILLDRINSLLKMR